jgi:AcrR family transcriptional regulator
VSTADVRHERHLRADARRNRQRVLEAAEEEFALQGLAVPIDDIARRAGVGPGTVYRHFPTKEALFAAIVARRMEDLVEEARTLAASDDPAEAFFHFLTRIFEEGARKRDLVDALGAAGVDIKTELGHAGFDMRDTIERLLVRGQQAGGVRADIGVEDVMALLTGTSLAMRRPGADAGLQQRMVGVVCDGLRARRS